MRRVPGAVAIASVIGATALMSCSDVGGCAVSGNWGWESNGNPAGSSLRIQLALSGNSIVGSGLSVGIGPTLVQDSVSITGSWLSGRAINLDLHYASGRHLAYAGILACPDTLSGTATDSTHAYTLVFLRNR